MSVKKQLKRLEGQLGGTFESPLHYSHGHGFHTDIMTRDPTTGKAIKIRHKPLEETLFEHKPLWKSLERPAMRKSPY